MEQIEVYSKIAVNISAIILVMVAVVFIIVEIFKPKRLSSFQEAEIKLHVKSLENAVATLLKIIAEYAKKNKQESTTWRIPTNNMPEPHVHYFETPLTLNGETMFKCEFPDCNTYSPVKGSGSRI